jgi:hypothetical protein
METYVNNSPFLAFQEYYEIFLQRLTVIRWVMKTIEIFCPSDGPDHPNGRLVSMIDKKSSKNVVS